AAPGRREGGRDRRSLSAVLPRGVPQARSARQRRRRLRRDLGPALGRAHLAPLPQPRARQAYRGPGGGIPGTARRQVSEPLRLLCGRPARPHQRGDRRRDPRRDREAAERGRVRSRARDGQAPGPGRAGAQDERERGPRLGARRHSGALRRLARALPPGRPDRARDEGGHPPGRGGDLHPRQPPRRAHRDRIARAGRGGAGAGEEAVRQAAPAILALLLGAAAGAQEVPRTWQDVPKPPLRPFSIPQPRRIELPNGLVLFLLEDHELPLVQATAMLRWGSRAEPADRAGMGQILSEAWRAGGTARRSGDALDDFLESRAAKVESWVGVASSGITLSCLKEDFAAVFEALVELVLEPAFAADKV